MNKQKLLYVLFGFASLLLLQGCFDDDDDEITEEQLPTIAAIASDQGDLSTLVAALDAADLVTVLDDPNGEFTVFAPTDAAFALLGDDAINALLQNSDELSDVLTYHVLPGVVNASAALASAGSTVEALNGDLIGLLTLANPLVTL